MLDDFWKSCRSVIMGRATSPLFGAFALSWLLWNYRLVVVLLADAPFQERLTYISSTLYPDLGDRMLCGFWGPFLTTLFYIFIYPFPARWVYAFTHRRHVSQLQLRDSIEGAKLLTLKESQDIRRKALLLEADYENTLKQRDEQIQQLKDALQTAREPVERLTLRSAQLEEQLRANETELVSLKNNAPGKKQGYSDGVITMLNKLVRSKLSESECLKIIDKDPVLAKYWLRKILDVGLVDSSSLHNGERLCAGNRETVNFLVENGLLAGENSVQ